MIMIDLDDLSIYQRLDPAGSRHHLRKLPEQCREAWAEALAFHLPDGLGHVDQVVVAGMGGSGIGGDLLRSLADTESTVPVLVQRDYELPAFVDSRTLVIASSYSGNTEEVLACFHQALERKAKLLAMTTGGQLQALAQEKGIPTFLIGYQAPPRAALGYSFIPLMALLQRAGLLLDKRKDVEEMVEVLEELIPRIQETVPEAANPAKNLATRLFGRLSVVYGGGILTEVARRWKTQFNENSKAWAFFEQLPEVHHNAVTGYAFPAEVAQRVFVILLHSTHLHPRVMLRYHITQEMLDQAGIAHHAVEAKGSSPLSQMMSTILLGDYVSFYLALLNEVDPSPVPVIDAVKERLAQP